MTSNIDKANLIIGDLFKRGITARHIIAEALDDAGLLMPDLPEPLENSAGEDQWDEPTVVTQSSSGEVVIEDRVAVWHSDLRPLALALLAAENNYREHLS